LLGASPGVAEAIDTSCYRYSYLTVLHYSTTEHKLVSA
jgi:hypothetical protein